MSKKWQEDWDAVGQQYGVDGTTAKAAYLSGTLRHTVEAAGKLLTEPDDFQLPALLLALSAAELVGRYRSQEGGSNARLRAGLKHLLTSRDDYVIDWLRFIRHFAAHGAAHSYNEFLFDRQLIVDLLSALADEAGAVGSPDETLAEAVAVLDITAIRTGSGVVYLPAMIELARSGRAGKGLMYENSWRAR